MKLDPPKPFGLTHDSFVRNWQGGKQTTYAENYEKIFRSGRTNAPGYTRVVYRGSKRTEIRNADQVSRAEAGLAPLKVTGIL